MPKDARISSARAVRETVGRTLRARREDLDLTQAALALRAHIEDATLRRIERGVTRPHPDTRRRLESALAWPVGTLDEVEDEAADRMDRAVRAALQEDPELLASLRQAPPVQGADASPTRPRTGDGYPKGSPLI